RCTPLGARGRRIQPRSRRADHRPAPRPRPPDPVRAACAGGLPVAHRALRVSSGCDHGSAFSRPPGRGAQPRASGELVLMRVLVCLWKLRREGWRPDVVHAHVYSAGLPALILGRLSRARVVLTEHYTGFVRGKITGSDLLTARLAFRYADLVAPVSPNLAHTV